MSLVAAIAPQCMHHERASSERRQTRGKHQVLCLKSSNYGNLASSSGANSTFSSSTRGNIVTYSSIISSKIQLLESPEVSFDEYLQDRPRVLKAVFPAHKGSYRLNEEEWKVQMLPMQFLFVSACMVIVIRLRCKTHGKGYPATVPDHATSVLELQVTNWKLKGLSNPSMSSHLTLCVKGVLYPERKGKQSHLRAHVELGLSLVRQPVLSLIPDTVLQGMAETILRSLSEEMKQSMDVCLPRDFNDFRRERLAALRQSSPHSSSSRSIKKLG